MKKTYWQESKKIVGPARVQNFGMVGQQATREAIYGFVLSHSDSTTRLVELGCNVGILGWNLDQKRFKGTYVGIDSNHKALVIAVENLERCKCTILLEGDIESVPITDRAADIVVSKDVIEHLPYYEGAIDELTRICKQFFVLSMFIVGCGGPDQIEQHEAGYYLNTYNRKRLLDYIESQGFRLWENRLIGSDELLFFERSDA